MPLSAVSGALSSVVSGNASRAVPGAASGAAFDAASERRLECDSVRCFERYPCTISCRALFVRFSCAISRAISNARSHTCRSERRTERPSSERSSATPPPCGPEPRMCSADTRRCGSCFSPSRNVTSCFLGSADVDFNVGKAPVPGCGSDLKRATCGLGCRLRHHFGHRFGYGLGRWFGRHLDAGSGDISALVRERSRRCTERFAERFTERNIECCTSRVQYIPAPPFFFRTRRTFPLNLTPRFITVGDCPNGSECKMLELKVLELSYHSCGLATLP